MTLHSVIKYKSQRGAALLMFMLILILASSYSFLNKINAATKPHLRQEATSRILAEAKQALISYAVTYPDRVNSNFGPGYLPCPDINNDGSAGGACSSGGNTTIGRFPWVTLKMNDLRDSSGQYLWYALSDNYRNNPKLEPLNSETSGQLCIDVNFDDDCETAADGDVDDIVAIIIAPGAPVDGQNRDPAEKVIANEISNYLEGNNSNFDTVFVTYDDDGDGDGNLEDEDFNDTIVIITRKELMEQVEKRILGEANQILSNYFSTYGAYPWLSTFADPKTTEKRLVGEHSGADGQSDLTDTSVDFTQWGVANSDVVWNITDGSYGTVSAVTATTLTIAGGLSFGTDNDFDTDDVYFVDVTAITTGFTGTATASNALVLTDATKDFSKLDISPGDILENITDGSSGIVNDVSTTTLTVKALTGGTLNTFTINDNYQIRTSMGRATADTDANGLTLEDTSVNFTVMGIQTGDLIRNITDDSYGRISNVAANSLTVSELLFGTDNTFTVNDYYSLPRLNSTTNTRQGLLSLQELGEPFKTDLNFDWTITANATDITVLNSGILQNYMQNYAAAGSEVFDNSVGTCIWIASNFADCFSSYKDFVNISGNLTSGSNTDVITDSAALFNTNVVKRGDIAQNYDDETLVISGAVDAGNSGTVTGAPTSLTLQDTNNDFLNVNITVGDTLFNTTDGSNGIIDSVTATQITVSSLSGGTDSIFEVGDDYQIGTEPTMYDASADFSVYERYSYLVQNQTLEAELGVGKIQAIIIDKEGVDTLIAGSYVGESSTPMEFRPGDSYRIYQPRQFVVQSVASETQLTADNYTSGTNPDFDNGEYYRVMPAANSQNSNLFWQTTSSGQDILLDFNADFVNDGVEVGDIVENHAGAFGEITAVTGQVIWTVLYGGTSQSFSNGNQYTVYYDYVYSRKHVLHAKFQGTQATKTITEERARDVCLGYNADCTVVSTAVNFTGNTGVPLFSITDYQEDETTEVGSATFTPSALSSGNLLVSNIDFGLSEINGDVTSWFINNDWHKLTYVAYSAGDAPGAAAVCTVVGGDCLIINDVQSATPNNPQSTTPNANIRALAIIAGKETNKILDSGCLALTETTQDRTNGTINEYFESNNCAQADDLFQEQIKASNFNDQLIVIDSL